MSMNVLPPVFLSLSAVLRSGMSVLCAAGVAVAAAGIAAPTADAAPARNPVQLLPLGDSITAVADSYRYPLMQRLLDEGYAVEYVGTRTWPVNPRYESLGRLPHEGHGGKTVQFLAERIRQVYPGKPAHIVLLHAAHNQFAEDKPVPGIVASTRDIIEYMRSVNPYVTVLLAQSITAGKLPKYSYIPELNEELAKLAAELDNPRQRVILVDMADGWVWQTDTVEDKVHPTAEGGEKMAAKWYEALVKILPAPVKTDAAAQQE